MGLHRLAICMALCAGSVAAAELETFSPQGEVNEARQVRARFSEAMVPVGQADAAPPFSVDCAPGNAYWADERTWAYDLQVQPAAGQRCRFTPRPELRSASGGRPAMAPEYGFHIAGPRLLWSIPAAESHIDENQVFVLLLNGPAEPASLAEHVRCEVTGIHEQIGVRRQAGEERDRILALPQVRDHLEGELADPADVDRRAALLARTEVLQCARPLPANAKLALVWGQGVSLAGMAGAAARNPADQAMLFQVRDHFVARLRCERENARAGCMPLKPIRLEFTAQVARADLDRVTLRDAAGKVYPQRPEPNAGRFDTGVLFPGPFPTDATLRVDLPDGLRDDAQRPLLNRDRFPLAVRVGRLPPLVKFAGDFGIIERNAGALLPITLRNLEPPPQGATGAGTAAVIRWVRVDGDADIAAWMKRLREFENPPGYPRPDRRRERLLVEGSPGLSERPLPKPSGAQAFEVVGLPLEKPGYYLLEAESRYLGRALLGDDAAMYVRAAALVTNLAVHFKWGPKNSLAWVTRLDNGQPVAGAKIVVNDCQGKPLARASSDAKGMSLIPAGLPDPRAADWQCPLLVSARIGDDVTFARSDWDEGIETWRFNLPHDWETEDRLAHTVLDRSLFRPGETVHMKHVLRDKRPGGLGYPAKLPQTLQIEHGGSGQRWHLPLAWQKGAAAQEWRIPSTAKRGDYRLRLLDKAVTADTPASELQYLPGLDSGGFAVADFRIPLMKASLSPLRDKLVGEGSAELDVAVGYLNGGAAKNLTVKLRGQLTPRHQVRFEAWPDYDFARLADDGEAGDDLTLAAEPLILDQGGAGRGRLLDIPLREQPQTLLAELEYADPSGEIQTVAKTLRWWPAEVVLGFKRPDWVKAGQATRLEFLAVDTAGRPMADVPIRARPLLRQTSSYRLRLAGGFYGYQEDSRDIPLPGECQGRSGAGGRFTCTVTSDASGELILAAEASDQAGRTARTHASVWVAGSGDWWFDQEDHDRIDLIPEKKTYQPGEKARFQVRMPFRSATALVTVERDGILEARLVPLSGKAPVVELPIQAHWAPNVYVSALLVRGRVDAPPPTALVDLAKPAFKLGIAAINVDQRAHRLEVQVKTDRDTYQTRERAKVQLQVRSPDGKPLPRGTELVVAAVDEGLLELADNRSWDLLPAMMAERGYNLRTFTAQMQVTGKRHFGKKALPAGGGGGRSPTRELFDTLLYWNPGLAVNDKGEAQVEIPLNDSLTRFRIVAVALAESRFGTGWTAVRASRDLQIASGLPPVVRQGDQLQAHVSVRNASSRSMQVAVGAQAGGIGALPARQLRLGPGEGRELTWPIATPERADRLDWYVNAREVGGPAQDALKVSQRVEPAVPVRLQAGQLYRLDRPLDLPVAPPAGALPGLGEVRATLAASLGDGLSGVREYMRRYPYACLEQKISQAVATKDTRAWAELTEALPGYLDSDGLAAFFPGLERGSVALTAYLLAVSHEAGRVLPVEYRSRMEAALENHLAGRLDGPPVPWRSDLGNLAQRLTALEALSRSGRATAELVATVKPTPQLWPAGLVVDWLETLKRSPTLPDRDALLKAAEAALRGKLTYTGSHLNVGDPGNWWLMRSGDGNAVRSLLAVLDLPGWRADIPALVNGVLARQSRGHWDTTTANAWGSLALDKHGRLFDAARPAGRSTASLGQEARQVDWKAFPHGATASFPLPGTADTLRLRHSGSGAPYVTLATLAAVDLQAPVARGYTVTKELLPVERKTAGQWRRGDIVRVRLTVDARDDMGWVVLEDPVPAGASLLGSGLKRDSAILTGSEQPAGQAWPAWQERRFEVFRAYYEYVPRGRFSLEYTLRLNNEGSFRLPTTRVEAMYAPEMYGEMPNAALVVAP